MIARSALLSFLLLVNSCAKALSNSRLGRDPFVAFLKVNNDANRINLAKKREDYRRISKVESGNIQDVNSTVSPDSTSGSSENFDLDALAKEFTYDANAPVKNQMGSRLSKLKFIEHEIGADPYPEVSAADVVTDIAAIIAKHNDMDNGTELESTDYRVYGRITSIRFEGQFVVLQDCKGNSIQVMFKRKEQVNIAKKTLTGENINKVIDIGDVVDVKGYVKKTSTGELTLVAQSMTVLAKCIFPLPDLYHGLKDVSTRFRFRHIDIMTNNDTRELLLQRSNMVWGLRQLLHSKGFTEVETPILNYNYSGANAVPFSTTSKALGEKLYMRIAPEFFLKRLITGGLADKIFEIGKCFRNEGTSTQHSPEFTMIEIYQQLADANDMIALTEEIVAKVAEQIGAKAIPLGWERRTMRDLIREHSQVDIDQCDKEQLVTLLQKRGMDEELIRAATWGELVCELFKSDVEEKLVQPIHVTELPAEVAPLADGNGKYSRVFESYIGSMEVAHGCTEECNPLELMEKLNRCGLQEMAHEHDKEFMNALAHGMPPTAGLGIGIDRLLMALTGTTSIKNTQTFPLLKRAD
ncbi:lysyl-tRNA synthetase [Babesia gibsoni]|uniref:Lysyl-tRNA synthetase n=1 Tax=Babesia gibsoni TaxID=33632 RepID=A0AAD8P8J3_BABGI|nr:lysyl-tRNA synthetase [Babesia gibsoni]